MKYLLILLLGIVLIAEGCRPPRCPLPNCYVRLKHRHGGENWKAAATPSDFDPDRDPNANRGKEYRGVPWWKKNKNPKIGEGYKPGYKYNHKKPKFKKPKEKKSKNPEELAPETGEEQLTEDGEVQPENNKENQEAPAEPAPETPKKKGLFKGKKEKKQKEKQEEKPVLEEEQSEEENDGF